MDINIGFGIEVVRYLLYPSIMVEFYFTYKRTGSV